MRHWSLLLLLSPFAACDVDTTNEVDLMAFDDAAPPLPATMTLTLTDPLTPGFPVSVGVTGAVPNARIKFVRSNGNIGVGQCPAILGGGCLSITPGASGYQLIDLRADAQGRVTFNTTLPAIVPVGARLVFQLVDPVALTGSNTLARTIQGQVCNDDNLEDNDNPAQATVNPANGVQANTCPGDDDIYRFSVPDSQALDVTVAFSHAGDGDVDIELLDAAGNALDGSAGVGDSENVNWVNTTGASVDVFLRAFLYTSAAGLPADNGPPVGSIYTITSSIAQVQVCQADASEPDSDGLSARQISAGQMGGLTLCTPDSYDWFSFNVQAGDVIDIVALHQYAEGDIDLFLTTQPVLNADLNTGNPAVVASGLSTADDEMISFTAPVTGTLYLAAQLYADRGTAYAGGVEYGLGLSIQ